MARALDISDADLALTNVVVQIRGENYQVLGIIDALGLSEAVGMDGRGFLPYDLNAVQALGSDPSGAAILPDDVARLSGGQVILVDRQPSPVSGYENVVSLSCRVLFPKEPYTMPLIAGTLDPVDFSGQRKLVLDYLERVGEPAYYGVDGVSYYGSRVRAKTFEGVLQILIPIVIAALTVFSTMRGSVYERRGEIYVYNAVGIAPNHVFFMFMAEAAVYAVVGAMVGYLLSQGVGSALVALDLTRGMNMNYSSIETIYASLAIVGSVLLSTIIPARSAARLAAPSEVRTWQLPEIVNDELLFDLPFTFTPYDRVAILSYMSRWFDAHGEGGSGQFFAAPPEVILRADAAEAGAAGAVVPVVATTVWLKPYDLGVSQRVEILLPTDAETAEFIARVRLVRLSGTTSAWERTLKPFMGVLRKQFLNWRAASPAERSEMYGESKAMIQDAPMEGDAHVG
ncbi:MAG: ABC transporter permease YtrF precursor [Chloroflexi bacterium ADurb.Bin325]|nr:MAG: ABC transporter permease YtrF precursor [Chloroflexi bacterium ADurb.Bin325]